MAQETVIVRDMFTGKERVVRVRTIQEWADEIKANLADQWDRENPDRPARNPWRSP